jgi:hypothetical protein
MAFVEDFTVFLQESEFSVEATATTRFGELVQFQVIFDDAGGLPLGGFIEATQPTALAKTEEIVDLVHGCAVAVGGVDYLLTGTQPDGTGMTRLTLERAAL